MERVLKRHVETGVGRTPEIAKQRVSYVLEVAYILSIRGQTIKSKKELNAILVPVVWAILPV
ncbi:hypothetical protein HanHA300_Chr01g0003411 [Helianthus annuus]|nr:hypothetical protein HanHA300_Chr01g0003411 [Helianthus annuus]